MTVSRVWRLSALLSFALVPAACHRGEPAFTTTPTPEAAPSNPGAAASQNSPAPDAPAPNAAPTNPAAGDVVMRTQDEQNTIAVFERAAPAAVFVTQRRVVVDYFAGRALDVPAGSGSGFVWDKKGHIVTNFHVVQGAKRMTVTLQGQETLDAEIVGVEPRKDIAVLRVKAPADKLSPIRLPQTGYRSEVGQKVVAIGNPFGLDHTLTTGVISALGREVDGIGGVTIRDMVQTDAAINPGNSGGPLLDSSGQLLGMNTMIFSRSGASAGIGFAVPVSAIARVVPQIIATGQAEQVGLGIRIDGERRFEKRLGIKGVAVISVTPGSPAAKAGLRGMTQTPQGIELGDVVVGIDDHAIESYDDLYNTLDAYKVDDEVTLKVIRDEHPLTLKVKLIQVQ